MAEADAPVAPLPSPTPEAAPPADRGAPPAPPASEAPARPEWLPEKFKTAEDLAKSYCELEKQRAKFSETAKATAKAELEAALYANRPETVDGYGLALAEDVTDVALLEGGLPEGFEAEEGRTYLTLNPDSQALGMLRDMAHRAGASPAEWQALLTQVARENGQRVPTAAEREADAKAVYDALGEHGQRRVQFTWGALKTLLGDKAEALNSMAGSPQAIEAIEMLTERATGARFAPPSDGSGPGGMLTEAEIRAKMASPGYLNGDAKVRDEVARAWKALYPN